MNYKEKLKNEIVKLGLKKGDSVVAHSSLSSLGNFSNRAQIVVDALLEVLGKEGTLLISALSYENVTKENPAFNVNTTSSCVGWLSEYFRNLPDSRRSLHPTHSVCAIGKKTDYFLGTHYLDSTPCGENSPFRKLKEIGGKILFLGCSLKPNTSMHGIEELTSPPYLFGEEIEYTIEPNNEPAYKKIYITHSFEGFEQRYDRVTDVLDKNDYSIGKILDADSYLLKTKPLWEKVHEMLQKEPLHFVDKKLFS